MHALGVPPRHQHIDVGRQGRRRGQYDSVCADAGEASLPPWEFELWKGIGEGRLLFTVQSRTSSHPPILSFAAAGSHVNGSTNNKLHFCSCTVEDSSITL